MSDERVVYVSAAWFEQLEAMNFQEFPKIGRLSREIIITEKIDGTNGVIGIEDDGATMHVGSRTRWLTLETGDNHGFLLWATMHRDELLTLGPGRHFGEWWGSGIQRGYGLVKGDKRFSLFNVSKWGETRPACCSVVPVLYRGAFDTNEIANVLDCLKVAGSQAARGFMKPEGIVVFHGQSNTSFKKTLERDEEYKSKTRTVQPLQP